MISSKKIGVGITTFQRPKQLTKLYDSIKDNTYIDVGIIVNDGLAMDQFRPAPEIDINEDVWDWLDNPRNLGVGKSKNKALRHLLDEGCDYIFLIEDDIYVKNPEVFKKYIEASKVSGIQHFNYSQHGMMNKSWPGGAPNPITTINYEPDKPDISLYTHCVGAFSFYTRTCLEQVGLLDERYYNACEHVDHTYAVIKAGMHPPFWYFADIANSWEYLGDEEWSLQQSTISSRSNRDEICQSSDKIFVEKHGHLPVQTPYTPQEHIGQILKEIKKKHASYPANV